MQNSSVFSAAQFPVLYADDAGYCRVVGQLLAFIRHDAAGAGERGRLSENGSVCHVGLVQEDWWAGMVERRTSAGGHGKWGTTHAIDAVHGRTRDF